MRKVGVAVYAPATDSRTESLMSIKPESLMSIKESAGSIAASLSSYESFLKQPCRPEDHPQQVSSLLAVMAKLKK